MQRIFSPDLDPISRDLMQLLPARSRPRRTRRVR